MAVAGMIFRWHYLSSDVARALDAGYYKQAARLLEKKSTNDDWVAVTELGNLYVLGLGVDLDYGRAAQLYSRAAFAGHVDAQVNLGHVYSSGLGQPQDKKLAYAWFNYARNQGSETAQLYMSIMLADHEISYHHVRAVVSQYATIGNFPRLH